MNPKLKQFTTHNWIAASPVTVVIKDGPGTLHTVYAHPNENGNFPRTADSSLMYQLFDNATSVGGALILTQFGNPSFDQGLPDHNLKQFDIDFAQGLVLKLNNGGSVGSVTVVFS